MDLADLTFIVGDYNSKSDGDDLGDFQEMILINLVLLRIFKTMILKIIHENSHWECTLVIIFVISSQKWQFRLRNENFEISGNLAYI